MQGMGLLEPFSGDFLTVCTVLSAFPLDCG